MLAHHCPTKSAAHQDETPSACVCCTQQWWTWHACCCLLQAALTRQLRALPRMQSGPLGFTTPAHQTQIRPLQPHQLLQPREPQPQSGSTLCLPGEAVFRSDSLGSTASSTSLGPHTPSSRALSMSQGRQTAVRRYEPHLQPSQVRVDSQTAEGNHETELAGFNSQHRKASQTHLGFASPHVKALVGEVMMVDDCMGNDTHQLFCQICRSHQWSYYVDVRGEELGPAAANLCSLRTQLCSCFAHMPNAALACLYSLPHHLDSGCRPPDATCMQPCAITPALAFLQHDYTVIQAWSMCVPLRTFVAGDGNCGYRAIAVGLVVAVSELPEESRRGFVRHLQQLFIGMQSQRGLLHYRSTSQGSAQQGYEALMVCPLSARPSAASMQ